MVTNTPEDWELVPHKVLSDLRDEVQELKEKIGQPSTTKELLTSTEELKSLLKQLNQIFQTALAKLDDSEPDNIGQKLNEISQQNEQLAKAMVAIVDMLENKAPLMPQQAQPIMPMSRPRPQPIMPVMTQMPPQRMAPPPMPSLAMEQPMDLSIPPPPPPKSGLMHKLFK